MIGEITTVMPVGQIAVATGALAAGATALAAGIVPALRKIILPEAEETKLADHLPFERIMPDGQTVLLKDRSLCRLVSVAGINLRYLDEAQREGYFRNRKKWLDDIAELGVTLRIWQLREEIDARLKQDQPAIAIRQIAELWDAQFAKAYTDTSVIVICSPPGSNQLQRLEDAVNATTGNLLPYRAKVLAQNSESADLTGLLGRIISPVSLPAPSGIGGYLDQALDADVLEFEPNGGFRHWRPSATAPDGRETIYCAVVGYKALGDHSDENTSLDLSALAGEFVICTAIEPYSRANALVQLKMRQRATASTSFGSGGSWDAYQAAIDLIEGSDQVTATLHKTIQYIILRARSREALDKLVEECRQILNLRGITAVREEGVAQACFFLQFPGFKFWPRSYELISNNIGHLVAFNSPPKGHQKSDFGKGPIVRFKTSEKSLYNFIFHDSAANDAVGHGLIIAPTGSGKSVLLSFLDAMASRHKHLRSFLFDRLDGLYAYTSAAEGAYLNLQTEAKPLSADVGMNPFQCADNLENRSFLRQFLRLLTGLSDSDSADQITRLVDISFSLPDDMRNLRDLAKMGGVPEDSPLGKELMRWIDPDQYGPVFCHHKDTLSFSEKRLTTFDMTKIFEDDMLSPPVIAYISHRITAYLRETRQPALIFIDEAARILQNDIFRKQFLVMLEEFRKRGAAVLTAFQTPSSLDQLGIGDRIRQAAKTWYLFPNSGAKREDYAAFSLTNAEWAFISGEDPLPNGRRGILIKRPETGESVVVEIDLSVLGRHLNLLNSGRRAVDMACRLQRQHGTDWLSPFLQENL